MAMAEQRCGVELDVLAVLFIGQRPDAWLNAGLKPVLEELSNRLKRDCQPSHPWYRDGVRFTTTPWPPHTCDTCRQERRAGIRHWSNTTHTPGAVAHPQGGQHGGYFTVHVVLDSDGQWCFEAESSIGALVALQRIIGTLISTSCRGARDGLPCITT